MAYRYCDHQMLFQQINENNKDLIILGRDQRYPQFLKCIAKDDLSDFRSIDQEIQNECESIINGTVYAPLIGEWCLVNTTMFGWIRGSFLGEDGALAKIYAWDFGMVIRVQRTDIRVGFCLIFPLFPPYIV